MQEVDYVSTALSLLSPFVFGSKKLTDPGTISKNSFYPRIPKQFLTELIDAADLIKSSFEKIRAEFTIWEKYLEQGYAAGSSFSAADATLYPFVAFGERFGITFQEFPKYVILL